MISCGYGFAEGDEASEARYLNDLVFFNLSRCAPSACAGGRQACCGI